MQEGIKVIKLSSGDTLVADLKLLNNQGPYVQIDNPVMFNAVYTGSSAGTLVAQRWLETDVTSFKIPRVHIVAAVDPSEMMLEHYIFSLQEINSSSTEEFIADGVDDDTSFLESYDFDGTIH